MQRTPQDADSLTHALCALQVAASVLQLQAITAAQQRDEPLPIVAALHEPSSGIEDVLWHTTLSFHADLKAEAARKAAAELQRMRSKSKQDVSSSELATMSAAAAALVTPPVSLHLLRPDELKAGMITQAAVAPQLADVFSELFTQVRCRRGVRCERTGVCRRGAVCVAGVSLFASWALCYLVVARKGCRLPWGLRHSPGSLIAKTLFTPHCTLCTASSLLPADTPCLACCLPASLLLLLVQQTGHELYLRDPQSRFGLPLDKPLLWKDVVEVARRHGETAIGFTKAMTVGSMQLGHGSEPHLGVTAEDEVTLAPGDQLVVVALD
jgi:hypothetical protein